MGPALEALRYTGHQEGLREIYANLLATSLDVDTSLQAHPAFVDMIKSMSPDEARMLGLFAHRELWPVVEVRIYRTGKDEASAGSGGSDLSVQACTSRSNRPMS